MKPQRSVRPSTVTRRSMHSTVSGKPPASPKIAPPPPRRVVSKLTLGSPGRKSPARRHIGSLIDDDESTLLDVLDNLLDKGVVLNADLMLALADVDLVYIRLSAILCAADRVMSRARR